METEEQDIQEQEKQEGLEGSNSVPKAVETKAYEAVDLYIQRQFNQTYAEFYIRTPWSPINPNDVLEPRVETHQLVDYSDTLPGHYVRVSNFMVASVPIDPTDWFTKKSLPNHLEKFFNSCVRPQAGTHLFILPNGGSLTSVQTMWKGNQTPHIDGHPQIDSKLEGPDDWSIDPMCCIYPCFVTDQLIMTPTNRQGILLLGVAFSSRQNHWYRFWRSYTRFHHQLRNNSCQDITEDFIADSPTEGPNLNYNNFVQDEEYGPGLRRIAFYVCRGARLLVTDLRLKDGEYQAWETPGRRATRCLYQQGSLVVIFGRAIFNLCIRDTNANQKNFEFVINHLLKNTQNGSGERPLDNFEKSRDRFPDNYLSEVQNRVIFLGAIDSQFQSLCWNIKITDGADDDRECRVFLDMPDGGVIKDIAPWNTGFELIRWRCKYEQSWKNVIRVDRPTPTQVPFRFEAPANPYVIRRIVGLEYDELTVEYPYGQFPHVPKGTPRLELEEERDIRHFYPLNESLTTWHQSVWRKQIPPPPPPLYPPIKMGDQYYYTDEDEKVLFVEFDRNSRGWDLLSATNFTNADGTHKRCVLQLDSEAKGWPWYKWTQGRENEVNQFLQSGQNQFQTNPQTDPKLWYRQSIDRVKYIKYIKDAQSAQTPYTMETLYLKPVQGMPAPEFDS